MRFYAIFDMVYAIRCPSILGRTAAGTILKLCQVIHMRHSEVKFVDDICRSKVKVTVSVSRKRVKGVYLR